MNNKKIIVTLIICFCLLVIIISSIIAFNYLITVNYKYLNEDKKSIKEHTQIIHAKLINSNNNAVRIYKGEGYTIKEYQGGDVVDYQIFIKNKKIWDYSKVYPETAR